MGRLSIRPAFAIVWRFVDRQRCRLSRDWKDVQCNIRQRIRFSTPSRFLSPHIESIIVVNCELLLAAFPWLSKMRTEFSTTVRWRQFIRIRIGGAEFCFGASNCMYFAQ